MVAPLFEGLVSGLLLAFGGGYLWTRWLLGPLKRTFVRAGMVRTNFCGQTIPVGMGSALWFGLLLTGSLLLLGNQLDQVPAEMLEEVGSLLAVCTGLFVVGLLDDVLGNRDATGLRGHLRKLVRERELTTGLLKALAGVLIGLFGVWWGGVTGWWLLLDGLVVALSANSVNLLDLRPGRACKGVLLALLLVALLSFRGLQSPVFWLLLGATLAYFPDDLKARTMMGDAGSNLLGGGIGLLVVTTCSVAVLLSWLAVLVCFHLYAEKYSLSETIEKNRLLHWLDDWGRSA